MKKQLFYLVVLAAFSQGCGNSSVRIYRTVTKTIPLSYNFNTTGSSTSTATLTSSQIYDLFASGDGAYIEKVDVSGVSLSGEIDKQQNTATQAILTATVQKNSESFTTSLLNTTKLVKVTDNDFSTDLLGANSQTFNNAVNSLNSAGLAIFQDFVSQSISRYKISSNQTLKIQVISSVSANQRFAGTVYVRINATITYYKCEQMLNWIQYNNPPCD